MKISMIVAYGKNKELGLDNKLLWHIPEDLKNFKEITKNNYLFMGRKTYESIFDYLKKPLPERHSFVLTNSDIDTSFDNVTKVSSLDEAISIAKEKGAKELFITGGASIYKQYFNKVNKLYISEVEYEGPADCYFDNKIDNSWKLKEEKYFKKTEKTLGWTFKIFEK